VNGEIQLLSETYFKALSIDVNHNPHFAFPCFIPAYPCVP